MRCGRCSSHTTRWQPRCVCEERLKQRQRLPCLGRSVLGVRPSKIPRRQLGSPCHWNSLVSYAIGYGASVTLMALGPLVIENCDWSETAIALYGRIFLPRRPFRWKRLAAIFTPCQCNPHLWDLPSCIENRVTHRKVRQCRPLELQIKRQAKVALLTPEPSSYMHHMK